MSMQMQSGPMSSMPPGGPGGMMQGQPTPPPQGQISHEQAAAQQAAAQAQAQAAHQQRVATGMVDNITKTKSLVPPIKDTLSNVLRTAAQAIYANNMVDSGSKNVDFDVSRFDRNLEEFFTLCDQMEVQLKTSIECLSQGMCAQRYLSTPVSMNRGEGSLTYPQYINVVKGQIAFAKEVHGTLSEAAQKLID